MPPAGGRRLPFLAASWAPYGCVPLRARLGFGGIQSQSTGGAFSDSVWDVPRPAESNCCWPPVSEATHRCCWRAFLAVHARKATAAGFRFLKQHKDVAGVFFWSSLHTCQEAFPRPCLASTPHKTQARHVHRPSDAPRAFCRTFRDWIVKAGITLCFRPRAQTRKAKPPLLLPARQRLRVVSLAVWPQQPSVLVCSGGALA